MRYSLYECGGKIRDEFLGIQSKDIDYSVVIPLEEVESLNMEEVFQRFKEQLLIEGYEIFLETPDCFTIRARFPLGHRHRGLTADFVLARKELGYVKGTRRPKVILGTLEDDLSRRDFTVNALAKDMNGNIVDLYRGQVDLQAGVLRTPLDAAISFKDDPLRILRGIRFAVTKDFMFSDEIIDAIRLFPCNGFEVVSIERVREELHKMFMFNTQRSLQLIAWLEGLNPMLYHSIFSRIKLEPTLKK